VKHTIAEAIGDLVLHLGLPGCVAHSSEEADIVRVNDELVVRVGGHQGGDLDHQAIHADLGLLRDRDDAAVVLVELADNPVRISLLVAEDVFGCRTRDTLPERPGVLGLGRVVGVHDEIPVSGNDPSKRPREHVVVVVVVVVVVGVVRKNLKK